MEEWKEYKLEDTSIEMIDGDRGKNYPKNNDFLSDGYCLFLNAGNVTKDGFSFSDKSFITQEKDDELRKGRLEKYDVVITTRGTVGNVALYDNKVPFEHIRINSGMLILKSGKDILSEYLYYYLKGKKFQSQISLFVSGSAQPQLPKSTLGKMSISYPNNKDTQNKIVSILKSLDDKIEINRKINENLEQQAQALFKSWFVDFEPFKYGEFVESELGMIPKGWRVGRADEVFDINIGKTPPRKEPEWFTKNTSDNIWVSIADMGSCGMFVSESSEYLTNEAINRFNILMVDEGSVLLSFKLTVGRVAIADTRLTTNEAIARFQLPQSYYREFLYLYLKQYKYENLGSTSSIATAVNSKTIKGMKLIVPPTDIIESFSNNTRPLFEQIRSLQQESRRLAELRDTLLPKLMSGEIKVNEIEK